jgi:hypothetical protein
VLGVGVSHYPAVLGKRCVVRLVADFLQWLGRAFDVGEEEGDGSGENFFGLPQQLGSPTSPAWETNKTESALERLPAAASGDTAVLEVIWTGTHTGPLTTAEGTIPASGKRQETPGAIFYTFEGDKIKESRQYFDSLTLLKQIGAQPK